MSGLAGALRFDGAPVDRDVLLAMTRSLAAHGIDAQEIWTKGTVGFAHALLRTTTEAASERQPRTIDGTTWIVADCRIDARDELRASLAAAGHECSGNVPDVDLILHAYAAWNEGCVEHLLGDFSFAIWDGRRRTLMCARDRFGIKPFYYARTPGACWFSNNLNAVGLAPDISTRLDDAAIADFLVFGYIVDHERTSFSWIRRVPPAHVLRASEGGQVSLRRYWTLSDADEIRYARPGDYVEQFRSLLASATRDRLRTPRVSVMMSGGLDSPAIAATARRADPGASIKAHTIVFDRLVNDDERRYSQRAADAIGIPIAHHAFDDFGFPPPEPCPDGYPAQPRDLLDWSRLIAVHRPAAVDARVVLRGDGADPLMLATAAAPRALIERSEYSRLLKTYCWTVWARRQIPLFGVRTIVRGLRERAPIEHAQPFPDWLRRDVRRQFDLDRRWNEEKPLEPSAGGLEVLHPYWSHIFESLDPLSMGLAAEMRYPFFDTRLVEWLVRIPPVPWCMEKTLLRVSMRGALPRQIVRRRKAPLAGNPWTALLPPASSRWWEPILQGSDQLERFVDVGAARASLTRTLTGASTGTHGDIDAVRSCLRPLALNLWLHRLGRDTLSPDFPRARVTL